MTDRVRYDAAMRIASNAAQTALKHFTAKDALTIESKGTQDWVSNADKEVEMEIRDELSNAFPDDGIIGEEYDPVVGTSGFNWIIDPIDGTTSFVNGIPGWCVVIACVHGDRTVLGVVVDPIAKEIFSASEAVGAVLNGDTIAVSGAGELTAGSIAVGHNMRIEYKKTCRILEELLSRGAIFYRIGSGALMLSYVAAGRLLAYVEPHMNAWDCVAAMYIIEKAGGTVQPFNMQEMLDAGGRVVASAPALYAEIDEISTQCYKD